jgi:protein-disulfide isomerase
MKMRGENNKGIVPKVTNAKAQALAYEHLKLIRDAKVTGTPPFLVNGIVVIGSDLDSLKKAIEIRRV